VCCFLFFFFFQAEDGIRDLIVTGVQTCALPISAEDVTTKFVGYDTLESRTNVRTTHDVNQEFFAIVDCSPLYAEMGGQVGDTGRSEERRVGKECRCRWGA